MCHNALMAKRVTMPCGWGCGLNLTARSLRNHFTHCPKRPVSWAGDRPLPGVTPEMVADAVDLINQMNTPERMMQAARMVDPLAWNAMVEAYRKVYPQFAPLAQPKPKDDAEPTRRETQALSGTIPGNVVSPSRREVLMEDYVEGERVLVPIEEL